MNSKITKPLDKYAALKHFINQETEFEIIDDTIFCKICSKRFEYIPREGVKPLKAHQKTQMHVKGLRLNQSQTLLTIERTPQREYTEFDEDLLRAFTAANIPLFRLEIPAFRNFLEKYTKKNIKSESCYRKHMLQNVYKSQRQLQFDILRDKKICLLFDETTDACGRYILNILIRECSRTMASQSYLVKSVELTNTNSININQEILSILNMLYKNDIIYSNLILLISDAAPYAVKVGKMLKLLFPKIKHVTCICHMLHRFVEKIRSLCPESNFVSSELKRLLLKNKSNQLLFTEHTNLSIPSFPVITRWGTWLSFMQFIVENYNKIKSFLNILSEKVEINLLIERLEREKLFEELEMLKNHFFLISTISQLESSSLSTENQIEILKEAISKTAINSTTAQILNRLILKNCDLSFFFNFNSITCHEEDKEYSFVPLSTADVERSFSGLKFLMDDKRRHLKVENLEALLALYFNDRNMT